MEERAQRRAGPSGASRRLRILLATDAWEPQVNGVVRTLKLTTAELQEMGHEVQIIAPDRFKTMPLPTYPEIRLALNAYEPMQAFFKAFEPEAIHIATEGPIGLAARRLCLGMEAALHHELSHPLSRIRLGPTAGAERGGLRLHALVPPPLGPGDGGHPLHARRAGEEGLQEPLARGRGGWTPKIFHPREPGDPDLYAGMARPVFLNVGRVAVEKNIEAFLALDLPGSKVVVGDGPQKTELEVKYPNVRFTGSKSGADLAAPLRLRRRVRVPLADRHLRPRDPGGDGRRAPRGGLQGAGPPSTSSPAQARACATTT